MSINLSIRLIILILLTFSSCITFAFLPEELAVDHNGQKPTIDLDKQTKKPPSNSISDKSYIESYNWLKKRFPFESKYSVRFSIILKFHFPTYVDLRDKFPEPYEQGNLGSCAANAIASVIQFIRRKEGLEDYTPSRLMLYYLARQYRGTITQDRGVYITEGVRALCEYGTCSETLWPYEIEKRFKAKPSPECFEAARLARICENIIPFPLKQTAKSFKMALVNSQPVILTTRLYDSFYSNEAKKTGVIPFPNVKKDKKIESHALTLVGYNDFKQCFIVRNSWGLGWGDKGYCYMPYKYILNKKLTYDCWSLARAPLISPPFFRPTIRELSPLKKDWG
jgi:C1A family cysteine protease